MIGVLAFFSNAEAQVYSGGAATLDWQSPTTWNVLNYWPGKNNDFSTAILNHTGAITINNSNPAFRVKQLDVNGATVVTLNGTGTLNIGVLHLNVGTANLLTIGPGLNVIIDSLVDGAAGSTIQVLAGATLTLRKGTGAPNIQVVDGGTTLAAGTVNSTLVIENGFNNGILPTGLAGAFLNTFTGEVQLGGNFSMNDTYTRAAAHGPLNLVSGQLTVTPGVTLTLNQTTPNSLIGAGTLQGQVGGVIILGAGFNANILPGARFANPFIGQLQCLTSFTANASMTFGVASGTAAQQGILNLNAAGVLFGPAAGTTLTLNGTIANSLQGAGFVMSTAGSTIVLGPGFNAGTIPSRFRDIAGTFRTSGPLQWNVAGGVNPFATTATFDIGGDLSLIGSGTFFVTQVGPNSLTTSNGSRISAQGLNTIVQFNPNGNNGVIPGSLFTNPFEGGFTVNGPMSLTGTLSMGTSSGPFTFVNHGSVVTIQAGAELFLQRNTAGAVVSLPVSAAAGPGIAYSSYFQGISSSSVLRLGAGFNGGTVPAADASVAASQISFLPLPFNNGTTASVPSFNGKLILEGSLTFDRDLRIGANGILDLKAGNYTIAAGRALQLYNSASNSLTGAGFVQGVAPNSAGATTRYTFGPVGGTAAAAVRTAHGSIVELGPGFNGATIPATRFASPFQGNFDVSSSGNLSIQGDLVIAVPGTVGYLNFNQALGFQRYDNVTPNTLYTTTGTTRLTINSNSSLRLNGIAAAGSNIYGAAANRPGTSPVNTIQGTDITSRLIIGNGAGNNNSVYARTTSATFLASPFNGTLEFDSFAYLCTDATIGVAAQLVLGNAVIVTEASLRGIDGAAAQAANTAHGSQANGTTLTLLNQGANTISGVGSLQAGTGNTIVLGASANGSIFPGNRFANPYFGTIATVGAMTLQGVFSLGAVREGQSIFPYTGIAAAAGTEFVSGTFMALGGKLTVDNGAVLTVSNATVNPIVQYNPLTFFAGARLFVSATNGTQAIDALPTGEVALMDGLASTDMTYNSAARNSFFSPANGGGAGTTTVNAISRSLMRGDVFASPFQGLLTIGAGRSRFNLTTGTLTLGPTARLNLVSPLYVSTATLPGGLLNQNLTNGFGRLVLNMTGAGSLIGTTTGSFIQSSVGSFTVAAAFVINGPDATGVTGGTVSLGTGFNAGVIDGRRFGDAFGFSGRLQLPPTGSFNLTGDLTMLAPSFGGGAAAPGLKPINYGILNLGGPTGTTVLNIQDGITLSLGTTSTAQLLNTGLALQGTGTIQGATNNAILRFNGTHGIHNPLTAGGTVPGVAARAMNVTAANIASPFNGRLVFNTSGSVNIIGNIVLGAPGTANGILELARLDGTTGVTNSPTFVPVGNNSSLTINNTSPVAVVLPGTGIISATSNLGSVILGPNALANILPAAQLRNPFIGRLIVATTGTGTSGAFALNSDLLLANDPTAALRNNPGAENGYLGAFSPINIASGITLGIQNTSEQSLYGVGPIQGADGNATVRFLAGVAPLGGNNNIVPGTVFANPYNGRVSLESVNAAAPNNTSYHLYGALTLGAASSVNGFLSVSGATLYLAASTGGTVTGTEATLTINNTLTVDQVLPGGGAIYPKGETGGNANNRNSRWIFGTGALSGIIPFHKSTSASGTVNATTLPPASVWALNGINGTIITPNASVTATNSSVSFINGGTLVVGGVTSATYSTTAELVLSNNAQRLTFASHHANALGGLGTIRATVTDATVRFGPQEPTTLAFANAGIVPGYNLASNFLGTIAIQSNMTQTGVVRLGDGSATTGRLLMLNNTTIPQYLIGGGATLDLRTVTNGVGLTTATTTLAPAGLVAAANGTSTLILHPNFATNVGIATPTAALINQGQTLLSPTFNGVLIASTGTTNLDFGNLTIGSTGALEIGGNFVVIATRTLAMNQTAANSFRRTGTAGGAGTGLLLANPTNTAGVATVQLGAGFNNKVLPVNLLGSASGVPNEFGLASGTPVAVLEVNGGDQLTLSNASNALGTPANFIVRGDLNFTNLGGGIIIPASSTMQVLAGFSAAATVAPVSQGYIQGTTGFGSTQSVLSIGAGTRNAGNSLSATTPVIGGIRNAAVAGVPAFTGLLRFQGNGAINGVSVTIGTTSGLDLAGTVGNDLIVQANSNLNLLNTAANSYTFTATPAAWIDGTGATSSINLGAGFNGGILPGLGFTQANFGGLQANMTLGGGVAAPGSSLTLGSALNIGTNGIFDFTTSAANNKLTLGSNTITVNGTVRNSGTTRYFITDGTGLTALGNVGNVTFPVGPSATVFAPINITNNGSPATFGVRARTAVTATAPFATGSTTLRQSIVNQQWNVTQLTGLAAGFGVGVTPLWVAGQENGGFNRNLAVTNVFTTTSGTISSSPGAAASDATFAGYFRSPVTVTQISTNNLNDTPVLVSSQPSPNLIAFTPPAQSSGATLTITGNRFAPGASVSLGGVTVPASAVTLVSGGSSGIDTLRVVVPTNAASGNVVVTQTGGSSTATGFTFLGAPIQPAVIYTVVPSPIPAGLGDVEVTINGAAFGLLTPRVIAVGSGITSTLTPSSNTTTKIVVTVPGQVVRNVGSVVFTVTSLDRLPVSTTVTVSTPPALVLTSLAPASTTGNLRVFTLKVNGNNFSAQSVFTLGTSTLRVQSVTRNADGTLTANLEAPVGVVSGNVNVLNLNGQSASLPFVVNNLPRPLVTSVSPNVLPPGSPNTIITIRGRYFIPGAVIFFNGQQLSGLQLSGDSLITVTVPAALLANPDLAVLTITNPDNQSIGYRLPITVGAPGAVNLTSVTPSVTTATGNAFTATLTGTGFSGAVRAFLGGQALTVVSTSDTQVRVVVPGNQLTGTYAVQVANPSGVVSNSLSMTINPNIDPALAVSISTVEPRSILAFTGTTNFVINGVNFAQGATVRLGSVQLVVSSVTANRIIATLPNTFAGGVYTLSVTNPNGSTGSQDYLVGPDAVSNDPLAGIRVYPNPVAEMVSVEANLERAAKVVISVTNSLGQRVMVVEQNAAAGFYSRSLNINSLPSGAYMVEITDGTRRSVEKIIKN